LAKTGSSVCMEGGPDADLIPSTKPCPKLGLLLADQCVSCGVGW